MSRSGAELAGAGNGGVVRDERRRARRRRHDGADPGAARARPGAPAGLPPLHIRRAAVALDDAHERAAALPGAVDLGPERGVELERGCGAWALVRASATEPVARVTAEAGSEPAPQPCWTKCSRS